MAQRKALAPPTADLALLTRSTLDEAVAYSRTSARRRVIQPYHRSHADPLHRMLNAVQPGTYVRPHRHLDPPKAEAWIMLRGALVFFTFDDQGAVQHSVALAAGGDPYGVDLVPGIYHSFVVLEPDTVLYEVKTGPYQESDDKSFAPWAPPEGDPAAPHYQQHLISIHKAKHAREG